MLNPYFNTQ